MSDQAGKMCSLAHLPSIAAAREPRTHCVDMHMRVWMEGERAKEQGRRAREERRWGGREGKSMRVPVVVVVVVDVSRRRTARSSRGSSADV